MTDRDTRFIAENDDAMTGRHKDTLARTRPQPTADIWWTQYLLWYSSLHRVGRWVIFIWLKGPRLLAHGGTRSVVGWLMRAHIVVDIISDG